ncbi:MAG: MFS transporter [Dehalococcoidales bacterium]|nr:MFS transporter [Dehalococcoidales bacterium]
MSNQVHQTKNTGSKKWWVLGVISFALFMILLDVTIVNIALPHIMTSLNISLSSVEWVINVYVLVFAALLLTLGKLGDIFGRRLMFLIGLALFTLSSVACSFSPNFTFLVVSRGIQAVGGAAMMPATLSLLNVEFSRKQRGLALGIWGAVAGAANALGPIIGGALVDAYDWRYIFLINIPIGIIAFIGTLLIVRESRDSGTDRRIDIPGVLVISTALFCLTFALVEGQSYGWTSGTIIGLFAAAAAGLLVFIFIELKSASPLAQLRLFRDRTFAAGNFVGLVINFGLIGVIFLLVLYLQIVLGFSAIKAGLSILPLPLAIILVAPFAGRLTDKIGGRWILFFGTLISAAGVYLMSDLSRVSGWQELLLPLAVTGVGMGMVMAPVTTVIMAATPVRESGMGAGILSTTRQIGSVMGISVLGAILQNQLVTNIRNALTQIPFIPAAVREKITETLSSGSLNMSGMDFSGSASLPEAVRMQMAEIFKTQFALSLGTAMKVGIIVVLMGTVVSLLISGRIRGAKKSPE